METKKTPVLFQLRPSPDPKGFGRYYPIDGQGLAKAKEVILRRALEEKPLTRGVFVTNEITDKGDYYVAGAQVFELFRKKSGLAKHSLEEEGERLFDVLNSGGTTIEGDTFKASETAPAKPKYMSIIKSDKRYAPPTVEDQGFYVDPEIWYFLIRSLGRKENIVLLGETGTGKTELITMVANTLKKELSTFDMAISNPVTHLCGNHRLNEKGQSIFQYARFAKSIQRPTLNLLDEISRAHPAANNVLFPVLDSRRTLYIENAMDNVEIKVDEKAVFWATANVGMQYTGVVNLDSALMDRFFPLELSYLPKPIEERVLKARTKIAPHEAQVIVDFASQIRANNEFSKKISTRQTLRIASLVHDGFSMVDAITFSVLNQYEANDIDGGERAKVKAIIQSM